ncbi:MAG: hypothetical protein R3F04_04995 [Lysobacteraceae bacterium]
MSRMTQVREIVLMNLRSIPDRLAASLVIVVGIAGVVGVMVALLSMSSGLEQTLGGTGRDDQVVITRGGTQGELASFLTIGSATLIKQDPGIARAADGLPAASGETIVITEVPRPGQRSGANVSLRGIEPSGFALRDGFRITAGRRFRPGVLELIVGKGAVEQFAGLDIGSTLRFAARAGPSWVTSRVVRMTPNSGVTAKRCKAPWPRRVLRPYWRNCARWTASKLMKTRLTTDPQLDVTCVGSAISSVARVATSPRSSDRWPESSRRSWRLVRRSVRSTSMYSAVSARTQEIGTLRALGFGALPVIAW